MRIFVMDSSSEPDEGPLLHPHLQFKTQHDTAKHCSGVGGGSGRLGESRVLPAVWLMDARVKTLGKAEAVSETVAFTRRSALEAQR